MQATLAELAVLVHGRLIGNGDLVIHGAAPLGNAVAGEITLVDDRVEKRYDLASSRASAVVAPRSTTPEGLPAIQVDDVHCAFAAIHRHFRPPQAERRVGVSPLAIISPTAKVDEDVDVHPYATIGDEVHYMGVILRPPVE